ncbi:glycosyltransferase family 2 protein, partial [Singulisphaera rosea]
RPFLLGKLDALKEAPNLRKRRRDRVDLARSAPGRPHFPIKLGLFGDVRNHLHRPKEASSRR